MRIAKLLSWTLGLAAMAWAANGQVVFSDVAKSDEYVQITRTQVVPLNHGANAFFYARNFFPDPSEFDGGMLTFPGPASPEPYNLAGLLDCCGNYGLGYETGYMTPDALDAAFPSGVTYTLTATNSMTLASASVDIPLGLDLYPSAVPQLSPSSFNALQTADPAAGLTLSFNTFTAPAGADVVQGFFTIDDLSTGIEVFNKAGFSPNAGSVYVSPGTFTDGDTYAFELIFDSADYSGGGGNQDSGIAYRSDLRTLGYFIVEPAVAAAAPEPAVWVLMLLGVGALGAGLRRERARGAGAIGVPTRDVVERGV